MGGVLGDRDATFVCAAPRARGVSHTPVRHALWALWRMIVPLSVALLTRGLWAPRGGVGRLWNRPLAGLSVLLLTTARTLAFSSSQPAAILAFILQRRVGLAMLRLADKLLQEWGLDIAGSLSALNGKKYEGQAVFAELNAVMRLGTKRKTCLRLVATNSPRFS